jgi:Mn-containing catalase
MPWTRGTSFDGEGEFSFGYQPGGGRPDVKETIGEMYNAATDE